MYITVRLIVFIHCYFYFNFLFLTFRQKKKLGVRPAYVILQGTNGNLRTDVLQHLLLSKASDLSQNKVIYLKQNKNKILYLQL